MNSIVLLVAVSVCTVIFNWSDACHPYWILNPTIALWYTAYSYSFITNLSCHHQSTLYTVHCTILEVQLDPINMTTTIDLSYSSNIPLSTNTRRYFCSHRIKLCVMGMQPVRLLSDMKFHCMQVQMRMWMRMHIGSRKGREGLMRFRREKGRRRGGWIVCLLEADDDLLHFLQGRECGVQDLLQVLLCRSTLYTVLRTCTYTPCLDI